MLLPDDNTSPTPPHARRWREADLAVIVNRLERETLQAVADSLGVSRTRVQQLYDRALLSGVTTASLREVRVAQAAVSRRGEANAKALKVAEDAWKRDPIRKLYALCRELGYVPTVTTLQWGAEPNAQRIGRKAGPYMKLYLQLRHHGINVPSLLSEVAETTGLQRERRQMGCKRVLATHCRRGHEYTPESTYVYGGYRKCRTCHIAGCAAYDAKRRAEKVAQT